MKRVGQIVGLLFLSLCITSCGSDKEDDKPDVDFDLSAMLTNIADNIIIPSYKELNTAVSELETAAKAYQSDSSSANFLTLQNAYLKAHLAWNSSASFEFGPSDEVLLRAAFNTYPVDTTQVKTNISSGSYNLESVVNIDAIGLPALDYLLYGIGEPLSTGEQEYTVALIEQLNSKSEFVLDKWESSYRNDFIDNTGSNVGSSLGLLVNELNLYYERFVRTGKIGLPAGIFTGNTVKTHLVEARFSEQYSHEYIQTAIQSVADYYYGKGDAGDGLGLDDYLQALDTDYKDTKLYLQIRQELDEALSKSKELTSDYQGTLTNDRPQIVALYNELQDAVILLKVDMMSAMSIKLTYEDTDGD